MEHNPFTAINNRLDNIERLILDLKYIPISVSKPVPKRNILNISEAAALTGLSKSRLYVLTVDGTIPNFKQGARIRFYEDELIAWLESGRRRSQQDIDAMADQSLKTA